MWLRDIPVSIPGPARHAVLPTFQNPQLSVQRSYQYAGTLTRLISFVCHSYANTGGVGVFFPFWNEFATTNRINSGGYACDANGNMTQDGKGTGYSYSFDAENPLAKAPGITCGPYS